MIKVTTMEILTFKAYFSVHLATCYNQRSKQKNCTETGHGHLSKTKQI